MGFLSIHPGILMFVSLLCLRFKITVQNVHITNPINKSYSELANHKPSCPPWQYRKFDNSSCECGDSIYGVVLCDEYDNSVSLFICHCMSYSDHSDMMLVGDCPYLCTDDFYTHIFEYTNITDLCNRNIQLNRKGQMCGKCLDNFVPSPYSYSFECSDCSNYKHQWIKYIAIAYIPLTIFFLAVILFRFNAISPSMNLFILVSQIVSCPSVSSLSSVYVCFMDPNGFLVLDIEFCL